MSRQRHLAPGSKDSLTRGAALAALLAGLTAMAAPPAAVAASGSWQAIGPSGGEVIALTIDPAAPATVYASAGNGGLFKTLDGGRHWAHTDAGLPSNLRPNIRELAVDPVVTSMVFAATGGGVWKSVDGGATWTGPAGGLGDALVTSLVIDPRTPGTLYSGSVRGVWKSVDGGASWFDSSAGILRASPVLSLAIDPRQPATLYAGTVLGVFKSLDHGASWRPARTGMGRPDVFALAVDPLQRGTVYAGVSSTSRSSAAGLFVSTNGGATWAARKLSTDPAARVFCLAVSPAAPRAAYACSMGAGLFKSTDGGKSWAAINAGLGTLDVGALAIDPTFPDRLYAGSIDSLDEDGPAVYKTASGGAAWTAFGNGIYTVDITALAIDPARAGILYAGTAGAGVYASTDDGRHWAPANAGLRGTRVLALAADPLLPGALYAETERGFFARADGAARWSRPGAPFDGQRPMIVDPRAPATLFSWAANGLGLFKTEDGGATWTLINGAISCNFFCAGLVLTIAPSDSSILYLATMVFIEGHEVASIAVSHDGGATFQNLPRLFRSVGILAVDPITPTTLYLAAEASDDSVVGLWKSTDGGQTVSQLPGIGAVTALLLDPADPQVIYAATPHGGLPSDVLVSRDGGATWGELAPGLGSLQIFQLALGPAGALYAGTGGASVWRLAL
jgi:photosystem II stability/assembly factor-like uncharacterized protein